MPRPPVPPPKPKKTPAPVQPYHHGNLREELVRCGKARLEQVGLADLSLRQVAADVGVSQVAPTHHFGNKEGLLAAIAASGFRDLTDYRYARIKPAMTAEERFRTLLSSYVQFAVQNPQLFHLMFAPSFKNPELHAELNEAASQSYHLMVHAAVDFLDEDGRRNVAAADEAARIAWMCMHGVATLLIQNRFNPVGAARTRRDQLIQRVIDVVLAGLNAAG